MSGHDNPDSRSVNLTELPYAPGVKAGVFACRAEYRPNPIAITTCKLLSLDEDAGLVEIAAIDAYDNTPLLDIKPYIGVVDGVEKIKVPDWYEGWPEWMPDEGIGLHEASPRASSLQLSPRQGEYLEGGRGSLTTN